MTLLYPARAWRGGLVALACALLLAACGKPESAPPKLQGPPATASSTGKPHKAAFGLASAGSDTRDQRTELVLRFNAPLAAAQAFDSQIAVAGPNGETVSGSWSLDDDNETLRFPFVQPDRHYAVTLRAKLLAADGHTLGRDEKRDVYSGSVPPAIGFASHGSVLPARGTRGLPLVSVNVHDADIEFFKVHDDALSDLYCAYPQNKHRDNYELDHEDNVWDTCENDRVKRPITEMADSVYANHYTLGGADNERTVTYIPVQNVRELSAPGVYMAVVKAGGTFKGSYDTAVFFVSDLGLHLRVYRDNSLLHVASLRDGSPVANVAVEIDGANGAAKLKAATDAGGNALLAYTVKPDDVLIARHGGDVSVLPFNRPALDISNFDVTGRRQAPFEVFAWSGRDLYRPGETLRVSALLRDYDGKPMKPQSLFVRLKQPDGRALPDQRLEPAKLGYFEMTQAIPADAPTGLWQLEFRLDPASKESVQAFPFHVEEFLPERLKLALDSQQARLVPDEPLKLQVAASYLYGAPADGNRFTAKLLVAPEVHPLDNLQDTFFGDPTLDLPKAANDVIDTRLDAQGALQQDVNLPDDVKPVAPLAVTVSGSVYESGGRAVTRTMKRVYWPAPQLVGVRPEFDPKQGAESEGQAGFEIVRADVDGRLVAGSHLKVRLQRELRDFYWLYEHGDGGWKSDAHQQLQLIEEKDIDVAAGGRARVEFPVQWGGYRLEVYDPATKLTTVFPFFAGWSWDDENLGKEARPDKVKLKLDKPRYRAGDTMKVTVTPPHDGPGVLLVESDHLLYLKDIDAGAGSTFEIPVTKDWERHDVYVSALVFRGGAADEHSTPARALGIEHVAMQRDDRRIPLALGAPAMMRPGNPLDVTVQAKGLAGTQAFVTLSAVDQGVINITDYPVPDAWTWMFAQRALSVDAYDLYSRIIEAMDGSEAKLRYGGDMAAKPLPHAARLNPEVKIVDLFAEPVQFDAQGKATLRVDVPDFNGSLRLSALAWSADRFGNADGSITVRAPLVVEPSTPRVMAAGDTAQVSLDLKNLSGKDGTAKVSVKTAGPISIADADRAMPLKDGAGATLAMPVTAQAGAAVAKLDIHAELNDYKVDRHFEFAVRPAWP
ncbi:MAG: alpha-2-macroglobulin family protein, partial [Proteobacteria bacterium]|nr:alpha-2-macroglobulin family protein [Pseudomonadota bacterium]